MFPNLWRYVQGPAGRRGPRRFRLLLEGLEDRLTPATITVLGTGDDVGVLIPTGPGTFTDTTLRGAINAANMMPGQDLINFAIPGPGDVKSIIPSLALPTITESVVIAGPAPSGPTDNPKIVLSGLLAPAGTNGLTITADHCTVQNLALLGFRDGSGILLTGHDATDNVVAGCWLGPNTDGFSATPNLNGVSITGGASNNTVGVVAVSANVISGNTANGVLISGAGTTGNRVEGNSIGLNEAQTAPLPNGLNGVLITGAASGNSVGDTTAFEAGNIISANGVSGVQISGTGTTGNLVVNNFIGLNALGTASGNGVGVLITGGASSNIVGATTLFSGNVISGNLGSGVVLEGPGTTGNVVQGNFIGTDPSGTSALGNGLEGVRLRAGASDNTIGGASDFAGGLISGNVISGNTDNGVVIQDGGTTGNVVLGNLLGTDFLGTTAVANHTNGVRIFNGATGNSIGGTAASARNIIAGNTETGVKIEDAGTMGNVVAGNFIGTDVTGTAALPNVVGVLLDHGANDNTIGGTAPGARNVIAGNSDKGVQVMDPGTMHNTVAGNYIGTDATGTVALHNSIAGVVIFSGATGNTVGGTAPGARNVISGNDGHGVQIAGAGTSGNTVAGNFIGTDATGTAAVPNGGSGVLINTGASDNTVGGTTPAARNVISGNKGDGVTIEDDGTMGNVVAGNFIGTNKDGTHELHNGSGVSLGTGASGNTVGGTAPGARNLIAGNNFVGVILAGAGTEHNTVAGNFIGTNLDGTLALANGGAGGVFITAGASNNTIGGTTLAARNVISGNFSDGVKIAGAGTTGNVVAGNFIGTNFDGTAALGNGFDGVSIDSGASGNTVGGTIAPARNVISGNGALASGVVISGAGTTGNTVAGNFIGTQADGVSALGNGANGVFIGSGAGTNTVGGTDPVSGNVIAHNSKGVVLAGPGGLGGGPAGAGNRINGNRIFANTGLGIDLGNDGATANDPGDGDAGPNNLQNFPVLTAAGGTTVTGTLNSTPGAPFRVEVFATPAGGPAGQGQTFLGFADVTTGAAGNAGFTATVAAIPAGQVVTATATNSTTGDTSEFSSSITVTVPGTAAAAAGAPTGTPAASPAAAAAGAVADVTGRVRIVLRQAHFLRARGLTRLRIRLRNTSPTPLTGPVSFVLDRLTPGVKLVSRSGVTARFAPLKSPWQTVPLGPSNLVAVAPVASAPPPFAVTQFGGDAASFAPGEVRELILTFRNPTGGRIRFSFRVLAGPGVR